MFMQGGTSIRWKQRCYEEFKDNYLDYVQLVRALILYIEKIYKGKKDKTLLEPGSYVHFSDHDYKIIEITDSTISLQGADGKTTPFISAAVLLQSYSLCIYGTFRNLASGFDEFYKQIHDDMVSCPTSNIVKKYAAALKIDSSRNVFSWWPKLPNS